MLDENIVFDEYKSYLVSGFITVFSDLKRTNDCIFVRDDINMALSFLAQAKSFVSNLESLALLFDDLSRQEFEEFIFQFNVFNKEVKNNAFTDHSHQWSNIEYEKLVEKCDNVASLLKIRSV